MAKNKAFQFRKKDRIPLAEQEKPYRSITYGKQNQEDMLWIIAERINASPNDFTIYIGTDSQTNSDTKIVSVIVVREHGKGGFYFYTVDWTERYSVAELMTKIADETQRSIDLATRVTEYMFENEVDVEVCIHADVGKGKHSKTKEMIGWVSAMVQAAGFPVETKPFSWAASSVADRISK